MTVGFLPSLSPFPTLSTRHNRPYHATMTEGLKGGRGNYKNGNTLQSDAFKKLFLIISTFNGVLKEMINCHLIHTEEFGLKKV